MNTAPLPAVPQPGVLALPEGPVRVSCLTRVVYTHQAGICLPEGVNALFGVERSSGATVLVLRSGMTPAQRRRARRLAMATPGVTVTGPLRPGAAAVVMGALSWARHAGQAQLTSALAAGHGVAAAVTVAAVGAAAAGIGLGATPAALPHPHHHGHTRHPGGGAPPAPPAPVRGRRRVTASHRGGTPGKRGTTPPGRPSPLALPSTTPGPGATPVPVPTTAVPTPRPTGPRPPSPSPSPDPSPTGHGHCAHDSCNRHGGSLGPPPRPAHTCRGHRCQQHQKRSP